MLLPSVLALLVVASDPATSLRKALDLEQRGEVAAARADLEALARAYPTWELPKIEVARIQLKLGVDLPQARVYLEAAKSLAPENPRAQFLHGLVMEEMGDHEGACRSMEAALALRESYDEARFRLAGLYYSLERWSESEAHYRRYIRSNPSATGARLQLATVLERQSRFSEAETELRQLVKDQPKTAFLKQRLADFYVRQGRPEQAQKVLGKTKPKKPMRVLKKSKR